MPTSRDTILRGLPLFPLPDFYLFPGALAPLHIFEPRYRQMVADLLDLSGRLVLGTYRPASGGSELLPVGGLGEIAHHETLADGRYLIWVLGMGRVAVTEVGSDRLYRKADARLLADRAPAPVDTDAMSARLIEAIRARAPRGRKLDGELPLGLLADILLNALPLDAEHCAAIYGERCPVQRAEAALAWHRGELTA